MKKKNYLPINAITVISFLLLLITGCVKTENDDHNNTGTVADIDGNTYGTVTIGTQVWMASDLKVTHYRDGTPIPNVTDGTIWYNLSTPAYCDYDNNPSYSSTYGRLYNWYAVNTGVLAPVGWHVPTDAEWGVLEAYLGNAATAGGKLKETGTVHWMSPNIAATNETGFNAVPGGFRSATGAFYSLGYDAYYWAWTNGSDPAYAYYRWLDFNSGFLLHNEDYKVDGYTVRCIRD